MRSFSSKVVRVVVHGPRWTLLSQPWLIRQFSSLRLQLQDAPGNWRRNKNLLVLTLQYFLPRFSLFVLAQSCSSPRKIVLWLFFWIREVVYSSWTKVQRPNCNCEGIRAKGGRETFDFELRNWRGISTARAKGEHRTLIPHSELNGTICSSAQEL